MAEPSSTSAAPRCGWSGCKGTPVGVLPAKSDHALWWRREDTPLCHEHVKPEAWPKDMQAMIGRMVMLDAK